MVENPVIAPGYEFELGAFQVMPNHFHALIEIGENQYNRRNDSGTNANTFGPQTKNLASIIRGFKSAGTKNTVY